MPGYYLGFDPTIIILIPAMIFAFYAQHKVNSAYQQYAQVSNRKGISGADAARRILDNNGLQDIPIEISQGRLSDHYDPRSKVLRLSPAVFQDPSIASISIAAHEAGHAIQHAKGYRPLSIRNVIAPIASIASGLAWPILVIGLMIIASGRMMGGNLIFDLGVLLYVSAVVFQGVTLPVEFNASKRAIEQLDGLGMIYPEEAYSAKKVLSAAALTYVAALASTLATLIRILALRGRN